MDTEGIWSELAAHHARIKDRSILSLFDDPDRARTFSARLPYDDGAAGQILLDFSKTNMDATALDLLVRLADFSGVAARRDAMFRGAAINETEGRAVLHPMLRGSAPEAPAEARTEAEATLARMRAFADTVRAGAFVGQGGPFTDVVNIGIGGSDLGPVMATLALAPYHDGPRTHFISNVDGAHATDILRGLKPATTLVIIASKTFTTIETMTNAATLRDWMVAGGVAEPATQMVAVSSAGAKAAEWGIPANRVFGFGDFIGGRYSVWGPVGLSLMLAVGPVHFDAFLQGAAAMDRHFCTAPLAENLPVLLALTGIWHNQICGHATRAVLPYDQRLSRLPAYLQQLEMESNGKRVAMDGSDLPRHSGAIVWGEPGTNGQHAFYQLIHQGTRVIPCEFLIAAQGHEPALAHHHRLLVANCLAQSEALLRGRDLDTARQLMAARGLTGAELDRQARHRVFPGNRPSVTLAYRQLTPMVLGAIVALYEHRVLAEGVILGINSFDQWGVELGKELALALDPLLTPGSDDSGKDGSTRQLLSHLRRE